MKEWRRKHPRVKCFFPPPSSIAVLMHLQNTPIKDDSWGTIIDISVGGIGIETRTPVKVGQTLYLTFSISQNFTFANTKGVIRRFTLNDIYYTCGIEFDLLVDKQHLEDAIAYLAEVEQQQNPKR